MVWVETDSAVHPVHTVHVFKSLVERGRGGGREEGEKEEETGEKDMRDDGEE